MAEPLDRVARNRAAMEGRARRWAASPFNPERQREMRDYDEAEATEVELHSTAGFAILCGLLLGIATVMGIFLAQHWEWIWEMVGRVWG